MKKRKKWGEQNVATGCRVWVTLEGEEGEVDKKGVVETDPQEGGEGDEEDMAEEETSKLNHQKW